MNKSTKPSDTQDNSLFKRTGWEVWDNETFVEVVPQDDSKEHLMGDECWCNPKVKRTENRPYIVHNSADEREKYER